MGGANEFIIAHRLSMYRVIEGILLAIPIAIGIWLSLEFALVLVTDLIKAEEPRKFAAEHWRAASKEYTDLKIAMNDLPCGRNLMADDLIRNHLPKVKSRAELELLLGQSEEGQEIDIVRKSPQCKVFFLGPPCVKRFWLFYAHRENCSEASTDSVLPHNYLLVCPTDAGIYKTATVVCR